MIARNYLKVYPYDKWTGNVLPDSAEGETFDPLVCGKGYQNAAEKPFVEMEFAKSDRLNCTPNMLRLLQRIHNSGFEPLLDATWQVNFAA